MKPFKNNHLSELKSQLPIAENNPPIRMGKIYTLKILITFFSKKYSIPYPPYLVFYYIANINKKEAPASNRDFQEKGEVQNGN